MLAHRWERNATEDSVTVTIMDSLVDAVCGCEDPPLADQSSAARDPLRQETLLYYCSLQIFFES